MKKQLFLYFAFFGIAVVVTGLIAIFVLPVWAVCDCPYNTIKNGLTFPGSLVAGGVVILLTHLRIKKGFSARKSFIRNLSYVALVYVALSLINVFLNT